MKGALPKAGTTGDRVLRADDGGVCTLTLNRPAQRNALDTESFVALEARLAALEQEIDTVGCVVIRGAGPSFCAGADLKALRAGVSTPSPMYKNRVIERLAALPQPVVAAVHGHCFTGGLELALAADFILADDAAVFADTHGRWGLVAAWGMTQRLPRRIGAVAAKRLMMTAEIIDAAEAQRIGLVDRCGPLEPIVHALVSRIVANSWHTNRSCKQLLRETEGMTLATGLAHEFFRNPGPAPDASSRLDAFEGGAPRP